MHEVLLTRGMVEGLPFEDKIQIYVPENCVLIHEERCHQEAQHTEAGLHKCVVQLLQYNGLGLVRGWLEYMNSIAHNMFYERLSLLEEPQ